MLFGFLSIVDQFGTVLTERGREFRESPRGKGIEHSLSGLLKELESANRQGLDVIGTTVDAMVRMINQYNEKYKEENGAAGKKTRSGGNGRRAKVRH